VKVGRVAGTVVSTINHPFYDGKRLLLTHILDADGDVTGYTIAVDRVDAGVGDLVLVLDEGNSARQFWDLETGPVRAVIAGIVDDVELGG
jgi:ethanolamine utilization protein EutN